MSTEIINDEEEGGKGFARLPMRDKELPQIVRQLVSNAPVKFKMPTFIACMAPLGCLATRLRFHYPFDQDPSAVLLQVIICSEQSGGKSFARNVESVIMARQKQRDSEQRRLEQEYRELKQKMSKNDSLPDPPKTAVVCCPISISIAQLVKRCDAPVRLYGAPLTLWTFTEELATATETNKRAFSNIKSIMRTAYDLGSEYGVDYLSDTSYSATVDILYNTMYCTTPSALDEYMDKKAVEGGNITRVIVCDLGTQLGDEAPIFKRMTQEQHDTIDKYISRMMADTYQEDGGICPEKYIDMSWLDKDIRAWCDDKSLESVKSGSTALGTFFKRSSKTAQRVAALCYYLYQLEIEQPDSRMTETKARNSTRKLYHCMADYILDGMMRKWGKRFEELQAKRLEETRKSQSNLFKSLPDQFNRTLLRESIKRMELITPDWVFLSKWKARGIIRKINDDQFIKQ